MVTTALPNDLQSSAEKLFAYLLHTLVRKYRGEQDNVITQLSVQDIEIASVISATRVASAYMPKYAQQNGEHTNGQRDADSGYIGYFIPETGELNVGSLCDRIADDLLLACGYTDKQENPLIVLKGALQAYRSDPENAPVHALYLKQASGSSVSIPDVAKTLRETLDELIWIYSYANTTQSGDWLHTDEPAFIGLVKRYERHTMSGEQIKQKGEIMSSGIKIGNVAAGATVSSRPKLS